MEENQEVKELASSNRELSVVESSQANITHQLSASPAANNQDELENISSSTSKKGVLWQQQNYDKFHQRLFSRWKKRYFILTTDYLVCFKRSTSKVGRSEMGKFLYKVSEPIWRRDFQSSIQHPLGIPVNMLSSSSPRRTVYRV